LLVTSKFIKWLEVVNHPAGKIKAGHDCWGGLQQKTVACLQQVVTQRTACLGVNFGAETVIRMITAKCQ